MSKKDEIFIECERLSKKYEVGFDFTSRIPSLDIRVEAEPTICDCCNQKIRKVLVCETIYLDREDTCHYLNLVLNRLKDIK